MHCGRNIQSRGRSCGEQKRNDKNWPPTMHQGNTKNLQNNLHVSGAKAQTELKHIISDDKSDFDEIVYN